MASLEHTAQTIRKVTGLSLENGARGPAQEYRPYDSSR